MEWDELNLGRDDCCLRFFFVVNGQLSMEKYLCEVVVVEVVEIGVEYVFEYFRMDFDIEQKGDKIDFVIEIDCEIQCWVILMIWEWFLDDVVVGEEEDE